MKRKERKGNERKKEGKERKEERKRKKRRKEKKELTQVGIFPKDVVNLVKRLGGGEAPRDIRMPSVGGNHLQQHFSPGGSAGSAGGSPVGIGVVVGAFVEPLKKLEEAVGGDALHFRRSISQSFHHAFDHGSRLDALL